MFSLHSMLNSNSPQFEFSHSFDFQSLWNEHSHIQFWLKKINFCFYILTSVSFLMMREIRVMKSLIWNLQFVFRQASNWKWDNQQQVKIWLSKHFIHPISNSEIYDLGLNKMNSVWIELKLMDRWIVANQNWAQGLWINWIE